MEEFKNTENVIQETNSQEDNTKILGENISNLLSLLNFVILVIFLYTFLKNTFLIRKG